ncbi:uncharacterized protein BDV17DRAFT_292537 [Aspergillus undulatus]|uniref:uncharacterized protein n=1 Tax=Aspergillus undulatus TaxID=1810928 RepID=UPI003CCCE1AB
MHPDISASHHPQRPHLKRPAPLPPVRFRRWSIPILATIAIGYGFSQYGTVMKTDSPYTDQAAEQERLRKNAQLMEAYGYKDNVDDIQKAMEVYEVQ